MKKMIAKKMIGLVVVLLLSNLYTVAQGSLRYNLQNRKYYIENTPEFKEFGSKSKLMTEEYGDEFLVYSSRYVQVYNYATYYKWFFIRFSAVFSDHKVYEDYFRSRQTTEMYRYISDHKSVIDAILTDTNKAVSLDAIALKRFVGIESK